jgi:hypothetical protein
MVVTMAITPEDSPATPAVLIAISMRDSVLTILYK